MYKARKSIFILLLIITSCLNIACFSSNISKNEEKTNYKKSRGVKIKNLKPHRYIDFL